MSFGLAQPLAVADVPGLDAGEQRLHRLRQRVVGEVHVGKQRVAAGIGRLLGVEDRRLRRLGIEHLVGVPDLAERLGVALLLDDLEDVGVLVHALHEGVMVDVAEALGEGELLLGRDRLLAEEDDEMLEPGRLDLLERRVVQLAEVDAADFRAERSGDGLDFDPTIERHSLLLLFHPPLPMLKKHGEREPTYSAAALCAASTLSASRPVSSARWWNLAVKVPTPAVAERSSTIRSCHLRLRHLRPHDDPSPASPRARRSPGCGRAAAGSCR